MSQLNLPFYLDEGKWNKLPAEDILTKIVENDKLKPTEKEWELYFKWLAEQVGENQQIIDEIQQKKSYMRKITARLCFFLHFLRIGIPIEEIRTGNFNSKKGWEKNSRNVWKKASFVLVPNIEGNVDWWCSPNEVLSLSKYSNIKVCHLFQTNNNEEDENQIRDELIRRIKEEFERKEEKRLNIINNASILMDQVREKVKIINKNLDEYLKIIQLKEEEFAELKKCFFGLENSFHRNRNNINLEMLEEVVELTNQLNNYQLKYFLNYYLLEEELKRIQQEEDEKKKKEDEEEEKRRIDLEEQKRIEQELLNAIATKSKSYVIDSLLPKDNNNNNNNNNNNYY